MENGFNKKGTKDVNDIFDKILSKKNVFYSVKEYTNAYTSFNCLEMDKSTFIYVFFSMWSVFLIIFIVHLNTRAVLVEMNIQIYYKRFLIRFT